MKRTKFLRKKKSHFVRENENRQHNENLPEKNRVYNWS